MRLEQVSAMSEGRRDRRWGAPVLAAGAGGVCRLGCGCGLQHGFEVGEGMESGLASGFEREG